MLTAANDWNSNAGAPSLPKFIAGTSYPHLNGAYLSTDGGRSFSFRGFMPRPAGMFTSDPSVGYDRYGHALYSYVTGGPHEGSHWPAVLLDHSPDAGATWSRHPAVVSEDSNTRAAGCRIDDFPHLAVDSTRNLIYVTWQRQQFPFNKCGNFNDETAETVWVTVSRDGGTTFSRAVRVDTGAHQIHIVPWPAVGPDGTLYVAYLTATNSTACSQSLAFHVVVARSADRGSNFSRSIALNTCGQASPRIAVSSRNGHLAVVDSADGPNGVGQSIHEAFSTDGGRNWRRGSATGGTASGYLLDTISYAPNGDLFSLYLTLAPATVNPAQLSVRPYGYIYDAFLARSRDDGRSWATAMRLTTQTSTWPTCGITGPCEVGDYIGIAVGRDGIVHPVWPDHRDPTGPMNIWTRSVADGQ